MDFFDPSRFPARWNCGDWPDYLAWLHIISDLIIFASYTLIPIITIIYMRRRPHLYFSKLFILFSLFILFCGIGHLIEAIIFWYPIYPFAGLNKAITALVSAGTVISLFYYLPRALNLPELASVNQQLQEHTSRLQKLGSELDIERARLIRAQAIGNIGDWRYDIEKDTIYWSDQVYYLFERDIDAGPPQSLEENLRYYTEESAAALTKQVADAIQGKGCTADHEVVLPSGKKAWHQASIIPELDPVTNKVVQLSGTVQDITERKRHEELFETLIESSVSATIMCNQQGVITYSNSETCSLFEYSMEELLGQKVEILIPEDTRPEHPSLRDGYFKNPTKRAMGSGRRLKGIKKSGEPVDVEIGLNPAMVADEIHVIATIIDVTKSVEQERVIELKNQQLESFNEELKHFAGMASHDLREPLRKMVFFSDIITKEKDQLSEIQQESLKRLSVTADKMQQLVESLLIFSKLGKDQLHIKCHLAKELIDSVLLDLKDQIDESNAQIKIDIEASDTTIFTDAVLFEQLLMNLVSNAIKYRDSERHPEILITLQQDDGTIHLSVSDNGIGFIKEHSEEIFKPFVRLKNKQQSGSGIGLATCRKICGLLSGTIRAESVPGKGSTFYAELKELRND